MPNQPLPTPTLPPKSNPTAPAGGVVPPQGQVFPPAQSPGVPTAMTAGSNPAAAASSAAPTNVPKPATPPTPQPMPKSGITPAVAPGAQPGTPVASTNPANPALVKPPGSPPLTTPPGLPAGLPKPPGTLPPLPGKPPVAGTGMASGSPTNPPAGTTPPGSPPAGANPQAATPAGKQPLFASVKKSPFKFLPFALGGIALVALLGFVGYRLLNRSSGSPTTPTANTNTQNSNRTTVPAKQTTVTYWGLWEPTEVLSGVLKEFEQANPGIKVEYVKQSHRDYRERVQTAIASGNGPDVFRFHASWVPMLKTELSPMPTSVMSPTEFQQTFYPVAQKQLQHNNQLVGVPLMYDGLALYYNKEALRTAGAEPPTTWAALRTLSTQLTIRSGDKIQRGGLAIGTAGNVEHFADILGLLMLQNGADLSNPTTAQARDALTFYTNFATVDKVWDQSLPNSTVAFARGDVAMMFAPSWRAHEIKSLNPQLEFGVAPLPKLVENKVTWATYWAEGVSAQSKNKDVSWKLLKFLSSKDIMKKLYSAQAQTRSFGEPYSRVDLANELASDPVVAAYLTDAPAAQGWYLNSATHDNGLNDNLIKYYEDAINAVIAGKAPTETLTTVDQGTKQVLRQYSIPVTGGTTGAAGSAGAASGATTGTTTGGTGTTPTTTTTR